VGFAPSLHRTYSGAQVSSTSLFADKFKVFIDGEAGTTGLQVRQRIEARDDLEIISPPSDLRKDVETRKKFINEADVVILCKSNCDVAVAFVNEVMMALIVPVSPTSP
jgi:N-acetyl-gamma-glutamylphosphate reductase